MPDDKTLHGRRDGDRVNVVDDYEMRYGSRKCGVTEPQSRNAVERAGTTARDVQNALRC